MAIKSGNKSIVRKTSLLVFVMFMIIALLVAVVGLFLYKNDGLKYNQQTVLGIAQSVASAVDGDSYREFSENPGDPSEDWDELKAYFDEAKTRTGAEYLYALDNNVDGKVMFVVEGQTPEDDPEMICYFGQVLPEGSFDDLMFETLKTGESLVTEDHPADNYGVMITGYSPIYDSSGDIVGVVGADVDVNTVNTGTIKFGVQIFLIALIMALILGLLVIRYLNRSIKKPIQELTETADKIAAGYTDIDLTITSDDEIGQLTESFQKMVDKTNAQVQILEELSNGHLDMDVVPVSEHDIMNISIKKTIKNLRNIIKNIQDAADNITASAENISGGGQSLASGSAQQAATIEELSSAINEVQSQTHHTSSLAEQVLNEASTVEELMRKSSASIQDMNTAMDGIETSSTEIAKVIKLIDDIASQTNLLSLNASVEAARAGQHGKGFAVVADEVKNLSEKSASAARETSAMIDTSLANVKNGSKIAVTTEEGLVKTGQLASDSIATMKELNEYSAQQDASINEIATGISQISQVTQTNSSNAEESAASAKELYEQSSLLLKIVSKFKL